jgi:3-dehydroquinate synthase
MKSVNVDLENRSYAISIGNGVLEQTGKIIERLAPSHAPVVISNARVLKLHRRPLLRSLERSFGRILIVRIPDGERFKTYASVQRIHDELFRVGAARRSWLLAFGGGVVSDVAGFAAATFMRGVEYINVPTTLLAQVDSSIGGKVGVNVPQGKNLVGAFHQPRAVVTDIAVLRTLPKRELASGLFEVVKYAAIRSERLLGYLEKRLPEILSCHPISLEHIVFESCRIKAEVVSNDETEAEQRMILNYGHTVGHALEAATHYRRFTHGEAVAWGMLAALQFGRELGMLNSRDGERVARLIHSVQKLPGLSGISLQALWTALSHDKKFEAARVRMILLSSLGSTTICDDIDPAQLKRFLKKFLARYSNDN